MKQSKALAILKSGRNVFLTGCAGTGKTYLLNQYINFLKKHNIAHAITASTGIASTNINGQTIHSWLGLGIENHISKQLLTKLEKTKHQQKDRIDKTKVLIIDEISMLHKNQLDMVDFILQFFKQNEQAFGGIQVVFSGDFCQLPPIGKNGELAKDKFCFMSDAWLKANLTICYLDKQYRQKNNDLNNILNAIRSNNISPTIVSLLNSRVRDIPDEKNSHTHLYTHNIDVDLINQRKLDNIRSTSKTFTAKVKGEPKLIETLQKSVLAEQVLQLKIGAKVIFVRNNFDQGFVNGTIGHIVGYSKENSYPIVETADGKNFIAEPEEWSIKDEEENVLASFIQVPLRLAWAITVHKSQGMTLSSAHIDLLRTFEKGQGYVALSRLRDLTSLTLKGFNTTALQIDPLAMKADKRFQILSKQADKLLDEKQLKNSWQDFILNSGGTINTTQLIENQPNRSKKSNYHLILQYIKDGFSLAEITQNTNLTLATILKHIKKIKQNEPNLDYSKFKPDEKILHKVKLACSQIEFKDNKILKPIYQYCEGEISYEEIKKALLFI